MITAITIAGVSGQMGRRLAAAASASPAFRIRGGTLRPGHPSLGQDIGLLAGTGPIGVAASEDLEQALAGSQVLVDFTSPQALAGNLKAAAAQKTAAVIGTTGLGPAEMELLREASASIAVLWAPNMSLGINLLYKLADMAARALGEDFDLEIVEAHHRRKKDAPSGTALKLAEVLAQARGLGPESRITGRQGLAGPRPASEIGILAVRGGDIAGEHTIYFCGQGERLELTHRAQSRDTFAAGALRAAQWLAGRPCGQYSINDVLGLN
ncbi:MAG: 4-hydroxy-tetrahydrodipicolinate reductase [Deltaproteobacteria bacterium]|jgi:4-hydroxy-tetrahydrodipicolinate reductase|nr:4-hydroxy-tetrahydrodipicolinate reductase [Deltaproteobacteria bacterium]